jgi:beta-glucosidase-like glycosyl hydrolase
MRPWPISALPENSLQTGTRSSDWWNEAVHGFARVQFINGSDTHVNATSFPMSIGVSSSFNKTLWREVGAVVGREARGAANAGIYGVDALTFWAVSSHRPQ